MSAGNFKVLSQADIDHFLQYGYVRVKSCFTPEQAADFTKDVWVRLGVDPDDNSTWIGKGPKVNMPGHGSVNTKEFAPKAWQAICELLGGEDRIDLGSATWNDSFIVNLGDPKFEGMELDGKKLDNWHVDGDFFMHFLDSPEQGLLVIPLWTSIQPRGGGTMICPEGTKLIAEHLYNHPEGVLPRMQSRNEPNTHSGLEFYINMVQGCSDFHEMTGEVGDVILMHPLMLHSASKNILRTQRVITNPPVSLKEPFVFNRENEQDFSLVELKTIKDLGKDRARSWKRTGEREAIVPERLKIQNRMKEEELKRLAGRETARPAQTSVAA